MTLYRYKELSNNLFSKYKLIDSDSIDSAKSILRKNKVIISKISLHQSFRQKFSIPSQLLFLFTKDLYYLLHSNLPLYESLLTLLDKHKNSKIYPMILDVSDCVKSGKSLSSILAQYTNVFSPVYISMIAASEKSGNLDTAFLELSKIIEENTKWRASLQKTLIYPAFLFSFSICILFGLFLFIIPSISELFEDRSLNPLTNLVVSISNWMCSNLPKLGLILLGISTIILLSIYNDRVKNLIKKFFFKISIINNIATKIAIVRFTTSLYNLLKNNVPILESLSLSKGSLNHPQLEEDIEEVISRVQKGEKFSKAISFSKYFPKMVSNMISTGEHSGSISPILLQINKLYHEEVKSALDKFTVLLQPFLLLFVGMIIGVFLLAVLIPLTDVSSLL